MARNSAERPRKLPDMNEWTAREIHEFWKAHSSADYWDETEEVKVGLSTRPRRPVSVKLSEADVEALKELAAERGVGYTTLLRMWIKEKLRELQATP